MSKEYDVGYGKPPKASQFKKGQSGNRQGRPKKQPQPPRDDAPAAVLKRVDDRRISVNGQDYTPFELEIMALQAKAAKGDVAASRQLSSLRKDLGLLSAKPQHKGGVLLVPVVGSLEEWEASTYRQQAQFRSAIPENLNDDESGEKIVDVILPEPDRG